MTCVAAWKPSTRTESGARRSLESRDGETAQLKEQLAVVQARSQ